MATYKVIHQYTGGVSFNNPRLPLILGVFPNSRVADIQIEPPNAIQQAKTIKKLGDVVDLVRKGDFKILLEEPSDYLWARWQIMTDRSLTTERRRELLDILDTWRPGDYVDGDLRNDPRGLILTLVPADGTPENPLIIRFIDP